MESCDYHQDIMKTLAECQVAIAKATERADDGKMDITAIFSVLKELSHGQKAVSSQLDLISLRQKINADVVEELASKIEDHLDNYKILSTEFQDFKWFRTWMNKLRDHLPVWALTGLVVAIVFILAVTFLKDDILTVIGWKH